MNANTEPTMDLMSLLEAARNAPTSERPRALRNLAKAVCTHDWFTISTVAELAKASGLCSKGDFIAAVREEKNLWQATTGLSPKPTDDEIAEKWLAKHPDTVYGLGEFRRYDGGIWPVLLIDCVKKEILVELSQAKYTGIKPTSRLLDSVLEIARVKVSLPGVKWDNQIGLLPCRNGVLVLQNRVLLPHSPDWFFTTKLDYDYDPNAICPNFMRVLNDAIPESVGFLQEFAGYSLTCETSYEIAVWLYGLPGSGKSSILGGLEAMLGSRAGILGLADVERSRFGMTNLIGKTLLISTEQPSGYFTATHIINAIISGETIEVDRKFRDPIQITPHAKVAWAMNELPRVKDPSNGLFRRIKVIEFPPLEESKRDPRIKEAIKTEGAGILNWALDGYDRLRHRGYFEPPSCVKNATNDFMLSNDVAGMFVAERCIVEQEATIPSSYLYDTYRTWCIDNGHEPKSSTAVAADWRRLGFTKFKKGVVYWKGVRVKTS